MGIYNGDILDRVTSNSRKCIKYRLRFSAEKKTTQTSPESLWWCNGLFNGINGANLVTSESFRSWSRNWMNQHNYGEIRHSSWEAHCKWPFYKAILTNYQRIYSLNYPSVIILSSLLNDMKNHTKNHLKPSQTNLKPYQTILNHMKNHIKPS